jgi:lysozyme family protein
MFGHIEREFHARRCHARAARAKELRREIRAQWLSVVRRLRLQVLDAKFQRIDQLRREQIPARFPGDKHEREWFHVKK